MTSQEQANIEYSYRYGSPRRTQSRNKKQSRLISEEINDARNDVSEGGKKTSVNNTTLRPSSKQSRESQKRNGRSLFRIISQ
jgi:hypothetical protein